MNFSVKTYSPGDDVASFTDAIVNEVYKVERREHKLIGKSNEAHHIETLISFMGEKPVAMAFCYLNSGISYKGAVPLLVGRFESVNHVEGAEMLFQAIDAVATKNQCHHIIGPMNGSTWDAYRLMLDLSHPLFFTEQDHPLYYNDLFTKNGYQIISRYVSQITSASVDNSPEAERLKGGLISAGIVIRPMQIDHFETELKRIYPLCMQAFDHNFLYAPINESEFLMRYLPLAAILQTDFALVAEDQTKAPVAFMLCLPDLLQPAKKQLIVKTIARHPQLTIKGVITAMGNQIYQQATKNGFETIIHAFMQETNRSNQVSVHFHGKPYREYALYGREVPVP